MQEKENDSSLNFGAILRHLSNIPHSVKENEKNPRGKTTMVEVSFASKMLDSNLLGACVFL